MDDDCDILLREETWTILEEAGRVAEERGKTVAQVAVRWLLEKKNVPSVVIGAKTVGEVVFTS